jgi:hypothetical protein
MLSSDAAGPDRMPCERRETETPLNVSRVRLARDWPLSALSAASLGPRSAS